MDIEIQIEHFKGQFAARNDVRSPAANPTRIEFHVGQEHRMTVPVGTVGADWQGYMDRGIEDLDDLPVRFDAVGYINRLFES